MAHSAADLTAALVIVEEDGPGRGLKLNRRKSLLYIPEDASSVVNSLPSEIPSVRSGFDLLGSPIGLRSHCEASMLKRVEKVQEILKRFPDIQDAQIETTILRSCLALPKVSFALRSCPPHLVKNATSAFDDYAGGPLRFCGGTLSKLVLAESLSSSCTWRSGCPTSLPPCTCCLYQLSGSVQGAGH